MLFFRSENWVPLKTVLFLSDIRADFSKFHKTVTLSIAARTIIIEKPKIKAAEALLNYVKTVPLGDIDNILSAPGQIPECKYMHKS